MLDLEELFIQIDKPLSDNENTLFTVLPVPNYEHAKIGIDVNGFPSVLLSAIGERRSHQSIPTNLKNILVLHDVVCRIIQSDTNIMSGRFTVVTCTNYDSVLQSYFLRIMGSLIMNLGSYPTTENIVIAVKKVIELFQALNTPSKKSIAGVWAELFLISEAKNPEQLLKAWHIQLEDKYDFADGKHRIEVKSSSTHSRQHFFSHEQLHPPKGASVLIASIFVNRVGNGFSIMDLADTISSHIYNDSKLLLHLESMIGQTLGNEWRSASRDRFDYELAKSSLITFNVESIPSLPPLLPRGITNVRYKSDLTLATELNRSLFKKDASIFGAAFG